MLHGRMLDLDRIGPGAGFGQRPGKGYEWKPDHRSDGSRRADRGRYDLGVDGAFTISVHPGDELTVSFIGYTTRKIPVTQAVSNLEVVLEEDALKVEDVVVIGYGTVQKKDLTGSIESISGDKITDAMTVNPTEALNGRVSGVLVTKTSNRPGTDMSIQIRGLNSFNYSNEPSM